MLFRNHMGKEFESLGQRMAYLLSVLMSPLESIESTTVSEIEQEDLYSFVCDFYKLVFDDPTLVGIDDLPDECENNTFGGRPYLDTRKLMRKVSKKITNVFGWLVQYGNKGKIDDSSLIVSKSDARITKKKAAILQNVGLTVQIDGDSFMLDSKRYPGMMKALSYVSGISPDNRPHTYLFRGIFDPEYNYSLALFREHCTSAKAFDKMAEYCKSNGFIEGFQDIDTDYGTTYWLKKECNDMEIKFMCRYDPRYFYQLCFTFVDDKRVIRWVLENFSSFDRQIQDLFFEKNKKCNKCGYCNQTDKSRPLVYITVNYDGRNYELCPYFQQIRCYFLDDDYVSKVLHFFDHVLDE